MVHTDEIICCISVDENSTSFVWAARFAQPQNWWMVQSSRFCSHIALVCARCNRVAGWLCRRGLADNYCREVGKHDGAADVCGKTAFARTTMLLFMAEKSVCLGGKETTDCETSGFAKD